MLIQTQESTAGSFIRDIYPYWVQAIGGFFYYLEYILFF